MTTSAHLARRARLAAWAVRELAGEHGERVALGLNRRGVRVMLLKGAWLQADVYGDPDQRPSSDLDLLVAPRDWPTLRQVMAELGYPSVARDAGVSAEVFAAANKRLLIDVHHDPFRVGLFALRGAHMLARGRAAKLGSADVLHPDPLDGYAHLIGHFAKGRLDATNETHARDFAEVARRYALSPTAIARHLDEHGLGRAARYSLRIAEQVVREPHHEAVLAALGPDPLGDRLAALSPARLGALFPYAIDATLPRGALCVARLSLQLLREGGPLRLTRTWRGRP